ncbi:uncharacterized protein A4U43_C04F29410 [Asparagus officinalis]|uniref:Uncharacterized protein n=1 Tax=Asparagus officinalis TaxID=4686 RepID=A0A5P1F536_ASPOF|nr:uncharacterized protein A4U43_C04F29410 [Asparagus officinalis]
MATAQARLEAALQQKEKFELKSTELAKEWDLKVAELEAKMTKGVTGGGDGSRWLVWSRSASKSEWAEFIGLAGEDGAVAREGGGSQCEVAAGLSGGDVDGN